jgi:hypothetical protein
MQLLKSIAPQKRRGYALIVTLAFLSVALIAYASMMGWVGSNAKITKRNNLFNHSQAAAESATEIVIATMSRDFFSQGLNPASSYTGASCLPPNQSGWPTTFQFSDTNGNVNVSSVNIGAFTTNWHGPMPQRFTGLTPYGQFCDIYSRATPQNVGENLTAMIHQQVWFGTIPAFQFAVFYNMDMEIQPGPCMTINGPVHSNKNIYAGGGCLTFSALVSAALQYVNGRSPLDPAYFYGDGNPPIYRSISIGPANFSITTNNPLSGAQVISLPIGATNDQATALSFLGIPPAGTTNAQNYPYNQADIVVTRTGTNLYVYYQNTNNASVQTLVPMDVTNKTSTTNTTYPFKISTTTNTYYSFVTNVIFYDYHEGGLVNAVQLDVGKFGNWLKSNSATNYQQQNTQGSTSKSQGINRVYISNPSTIPSGSPGGPTKLPGVRLVKGSQLPANGLTVATAQPIYVLGDYNTTTNGTTYSMALGDTTNTYPAALMGDAITILSSKWSDAYPTNVDADSRPATNTTVNAAILEGLVPTGPYNGGNYYSGGVENVIRLLETWSNSIPLNYNGSIVVLFSSQYATTPNYSSSQGTLYYRQPLRNWGFDLNFLDPNKLPPMTPRFPAFARTSWSSTQ